MSEIYDRRCVLVVSGPPIDSFKQPAPGPNALRIEALRKADDSQGIRVAFKVEKSRKKQPNNCEIEITNLNDSSRAFLKDKGARLQLEAGYVQSLAQIFVGDVRQVDHQKLVNGWLTKLQCGDGERAYQWARTKGSFKGGVKIADVIKYVCADMEIDPGNALEVATKIQGNFVSGYSVFGRACDELDRLFLPYGYEWSIQDARLQVLERGKALTPTGEKISSATGLIGNPEQGTPDKKTGGSYLKFKVALRPTIIPGSLLLLDAARVKGEYRAEKLTQRGDTHGRDWLTEVEAQPVK